MIATFYQFRKHSYKPTRFAFELFACHSLYFTEGDDFVMVYEPYTMVCYLWTDHVI